MVFTMDNRIVVVIPSYEPDDRFKELIKELQAEQCNVLVIDDGSDSIRFRRYFDEAEQRGCYVIHHPCNMGKGAALKTAFRYILNDMPDVIGCVTVDSDGQHSIPDTIHVSEELVMHPDALVLGCRVFDPKIVPFKSRAGNNITRFVFRVFCGMSLMDTQTGLRGISRQFMEQCLKNKYDRFEYETQMLFDARDLKMDIVEVPIETIYDSKEKHLTHFNPFKDSVRIYKLIFGEFFRYIASSLVSAVFDILLFWFLSFMAHDRMGIVMASVFARCISGCFNYVLNMTAVFDCREHKAESAAKYAVLFAVNLCLSSFCVAYFVDRIGYGNVRIVVKIVVDSIIFMMNYFVQKYLVFKKGDLNSDEKE